MHAVLARSTFSMSKCQNTWFGPLFEGSIAIQYRKSARLWREANFEIESIKNRRFKATFNVSDVVFVKLVSWLVSWLVSYSVSYLGSQLVI